MGRNIDKPNLDYQDVFYTCTSTYRDESKRDRLNSYIPRTTKKILEFESLIQIDKVHELKEDKIDVANEKRYKEDMIGIYKDKFSKMNEKGRRFYDQLKLSAKGNRCPFCAHREVTTLDHLYPKAEIPSLAIAPINLVPSCFDCNKKKSTMTPDSIENTLLHPYFDDISSDIWLVVELNNQTDLSIKYNVEKPSHWSHIKFKRLENEMELLELFKFYATQGITEYNIRKISLAGAYKRHGQSEVEQVLQEYIEASENEKGMNSWEAALYRGLLKSTWFCEGGFIESSNL
ncbi:hypothetical protein HB900_06720 [Listeria booriae]|uniref:HNH endonuclease n=1 Tax=Listeria booriae TaxID=1552123 RepID=UPI001834BAD6|nr:hypothetical protein [Listeria booriae]MBC1574148.1 hypothetical protein [Listeria booriae]